MNRFYIQFYHLLRYRWEGPSIGIKIRIKNKFINYGRGFVIPIPQFISTMLLDIQQYITLHRKENKNV